MGERDAEAAAGGRADEVTRLLQAWAGGDAAAFERLVAAVYPELRRIAGRMFRAERREITLQPTALVHEAFLRLVGHRRVDWKERAQFYGVAATQMRRILVDHARARAAAKRGGSTPPASATLLELPSRDAAGPPPVDLLALDQALDRLAALDDQQAKLIELRYFAGLTVEETAVVLGISHATVERGWSSARAFLRHELG
jgi:RNA polymerase sigma factor (TIGR02999 family)